MGMRTAEWYLLQATLGFRWVWLWWRRRCLNVREKSLYALHIDSDELPGKICLAEVKWAKGARTTE